MKQGTKKSSSTIQPVDELENLKEKFTQIKKTPLTRIVTLIAESCCGCGCDTFKIRRKVPYDSPLQDGDDIGTGLEKGDETIDD